MSDKDTPQGDEADERRRRIAADYGLLFEGELGRKVLRRMMTTYGVFDPHRLGTSMELAYLEGQRSVVLDILEVIRDVRTPAVFNKEAEHAVDDYIVRSE